MNDKYLKISDLMDQSNEIAEMALKIDETPIACIITDRNHKILSSAHNLTNKNNDPTAHAELLALDKLYPNNSKSTITEYKNFDNYIKSCSIEKTKEKFIKKEKLIVYDNRLKFFITCEPCLMCFSVLKELDAEIYYGEYNFRFGALTVFKQEYKKMQKVEGSKNIELLKKFYGGINYKAPVGKRKTKGKK